MAINTNTVATTAGEKENQTESPCAGLAPGHRRRKEHSRGTAWNLATWLQTGTILEWALFSLRSDEIPVESQEAGGGSPAVS